ncbi:MAG: hypothetical protein ACYCOU_03450 [Sulfobacillus sp.]
MSAEISDLLYREHGDDPDVNRDIDYRRVEEMVARQKKEFNEKGDYHPINEVTMSLIAKKVNDLVEFDIVIIDGQHRMTTAAQLEFDGYQPMVGLVSIFLHTDANARHEHFLLTNDAIPLAERHKSGDLTLKRVVKLVCDAFWSKYPRFVAAGKLENLMYVPDRREFKDKLFSNESLAKDIKERILGNVPETGSGAASGATTNKKDGIVKYIMGLIESVNKHIGSQPLFKFEPYIEDRKRAKELADSVGCYLGIYKCEEWIQMMISGVMKKRYLRLKPNVLAAPAVSAAPAAPAVPAVPAAPVVPAVPPGIETVGQPGKVPVGRSAIVPLKKIRLKSKV